MQRAYTYSSTAVSLGTTDSQAGRCSILPTFRRHFFEKNLQKIHRPSYIPIPSSQVERERLSRLVGIVNRLRPKFLLVTGDMTHAPPGHEFYEGQVREDKCFSGGEGDRFSVFF